MKKFTDAEIIKALECCIKGKGCKSCPLLNFGGNENDCADELTVQSLNLINRQKAEIERYKGVIKFLEKDVEDANKESAEVKHGMWAYNTDDFTPHYRCSVCGYNKPIAAGENIIQESKYFCPNCGAKMDG